MVSGRPKSPGGAHDPEHWKPLVLAWLADGHTLQTFCDRVGHPTRLAIYEWRESDPTFERKYLQALTMQQDSMADRVFDIADGNEPGREDEGEARARLRIDARIRMLSRLTPRYAEKRQLEQTGDTQVTIVTGVPDTEPPRVRELGNVPRHLLPDADPGDDGTPERNDDTP
ncbi:MAG: hypothetical protein HRT82_17120 [Henriciella sp.]|nr:hypothetical protein [Henriciella sp.]